MIWIDMDMPAVPQTVIIYPDGTVVDVYDGQRYKAGSIPPHGDLIDRDEQIERAWRLNLSTKGVIEQMLWSAPVVIPAEEGE